MNTGAVAWAQEVGSPTPTQTTSPSGSGGQNITPIPSPFTPGTPSGGASGVLWPSTDPNLSSSGPTPAVQWIANLYQRMYTTWQALWALAQSIFEGIYAWGASLLGYLSRVSHAWWTMVTNLPYVWGWRIVDAFCAIASYLMSSLVYWLPTTSVRRSIAGNPILDAVNFCIPLVEIVAWIQIVTGMIVAWMLWGGVMRWLKVIR